MRARGGARARRPRSGVSPELAQLRPHTATGPKGRCAVSHTCPLRPCALPPLRSAHPLRSSPLLLYYCTWLRLYFINNHECNPSQVGQLLPGRLLRRPRRLQGPHTAGEREGGRGQQRGQGMGGGNRGCKYQPKVSQTKGPGIEFVPKHQTLSLSHPSIPVGRELRRCVGTWHAGWHCGHVR